MDDYEDTMALNYLILLNRGHNFSNGFDNWVNCNKSEIKTFLQDLNAYNDNEKVLETFNDYFGDSLLMASLNFNNNLLSK